MSKALIDPRTGTPFASKKKDLSRLDFLVVHHAGPGTERWTPETFTRHRHESALAWQRAEHTAGRPGALYAYSGNGYNAVVFPACGHGDRQQLDGGHGGERGRDRDPPSESPKAETQ